MILKYNALLIGKRTLVFTAIAYFLGSSKNTALTRAQERALSTQ